LIGSDIAEHSPGFSHSVAVVSPHPELVHSRLPVLFLFEVILSFSAQQSPWLLILLVSVTCGILLPS
jgi:hypothetical protein